MQTTQQNLKEMMDAFEKIMLAARNQFPGATEDELFKIASGAMNHSLGLNGQQ